MMQRRITFSRGENWGAIASSAAARIGSPFSIVSRGLDQVGEIGIEYA